MFRQMRRKKQELEQEENIKILQNGKTGIISVLGDEDYPYGVPINYIYLDSKIYFHCAREGHKIDAIKKHNKVSFCVIDKDIVVPKVFGTDFKSTIAFGKAYIMEENKTMPIIQAFTKKYCPNETIENIQKEIDKDFSRLCIVKIEIEHLTGKQAIDFVRKTAIKL